MLIVFMSTKVSVVNIGGD